MQPTDQPTTGRLWPLLAHAALLVALAWHATAAAQTAPTPAPTPSPTPMPAQLERPAPRQDGDPPVRLSFNYDGDLNADLSGGARRGVAYLGKAAAIADIDLDRLVGLHGFTAHVSILDIHDTGLSASRVDNLATVSGIEAEPALRLNQAWFESSVGEKAHLRIGKFPAAEDFAVSDTAGFFINSTFGWPESFATDLPQGGPSWPLSAPGAMLKAPPLSPRLNVALAIFAGNPAGTESDDPQRDDGNGFQPFALSGPPLVIAEVARTLGAKRHDQAGRLGPFRPVRRARHEPERHGCARLERLWRHRRTPCRHRVPPAPWLRPRHGGAGRPQCRGPLF